MRVPDVQINSLALALIAAASIEATRLVYVSFKLFRVNFLLLYMGLQMLLIAAALGTGVAAPGLRLADLPMQLGWGLGLGLAAVVGDRLVIRLHTMGWPQESMAVPDRKPPPARSAAAFSIVMLIAAAIVEELLYRWALPGWLHGLGMDGVGAGSISVGAFALSHVYFGWTHVLSKLPLGLLCYGALGWGGLTAAIVAHGVFNAASWVAAHRRAAC